MMRPIRFQIELPLTEQWKNVELLRTSVLNCLTTIFSNHDFCQTIGIITGELLENALKYGDWTNKSAFKLHVFGGADGVTIEVSNPIDPNSGAADDLMETLSWLEAQPDPKSAFMARLGQVHEAEDESKLGLLRIAYEGNCTLSAVVESDVVRVCAVTRP